MIKLISFTDRGQKLAEELAQKLDGQALRCNRGQSLDGWTQENFPSAQALIFVGAAGIAVRAIAPYVKSKTTDPAVVVVDEGARFAIPILSGHLGGANDLARKISALCGAQPVVTTATDVNGMFSVDEWAKHQGCAILNPERIKRVSGTLLAGGTVEVSSRWPIEGTPPERVSLSLRGGEKTALNLVPKIVTLGVGCKRGIALEALEGAFSALLEREDVSEKAVCQVCSIDLKKEEPGLLAFCEKRGLPFVAFSAAELAAVEGDFPASDFVRQVTGVDNVCQRAAVLGSGGALIGTRYSGNGVTMALAEGPFSPDWRWKNE